MDNGDCLVLDLMANFVPYSTPDVDRWIAIVVPGPMHCQILSDLLVEAAQKFAFQWLEVQEVVEEDFVEEIRILAVAVAAVQYFGLVLESQILHHCQHMLLKI